MVGAVHPLRRNQTGYVKKSEKTLQQYPSTEPDFNKNKSGPDQLQSISKGTPFFAKGKTTSLEDSPDFRHAAPFQDQTEDQVTSPNVLDPKMNPRLTVTEIVSQEISSLDREEQVDQMDMDMFSDN